MLTFRNVHNWISGGHEQQMFDAFYRSLEPAGFLGVIEHRADLGTSLEVMEESGQVTVACMKKLARRAGFEFVAASGINANPKDDHDHPEGVWTLPPTLRLGDEDRQSTWPSANPTGQHSRFANRRSER